MLSPVYVCFLHGKFAGVFANFELAKQSFIDEYAGKQVSFFGDPDFHPTCMTFAVFVEDVLSGHIIVSPVTNVLPALAK